jgi:hypothetical protein
MCNHLNLKILIHIFTIIFLMIIITMRSENFVAHLDGLGGTPVAPHWCTQMEKLQYFCHTLCKECPSEKST